MFRNQAQLDTRSTDIDYSHVCLLIFLCLAVASLSGCNTLSLPAIDPTGNRIFAGGINPFTKLINPHDPNNGYPSQQPSFQTPPNPPPCMQGASGSEKKLCKGCLAGKGCLAKRKEAEDVRGRCGQLLLTPTRIVAPVGGEVILLAGVCGKDGYLVTNEPIEWMLSPRSVGEFVEVGDDAKGQRRTSFFGKEIGPKVEKLGVDFARGRTSREAGNITRGTSNTADDLPIRKGQTWISLTSPSEGISKITALAPDSDVWDQRRQTATIYWEDATWQFPEPPPPALSKDSVQLITRVNRAEGFIPAEGWKVRYRVLNPDLARFLPTQADVADVTVNRDGIAMVEIAIGQQPGMQVPHGTAMVEIEVIRPARAEDNIPELPLGRGTTTVTWSAAELQLNVGGPEIAVPNQPLSYFATVANTGDLNAENVVISVVVPPGMVLQAPNIAPTSQANGALAWELGPLMPRRAFDISFNIVASTVMNAQIQFEATGTPDLRQQKEVRTLVQQPQIILTIAPRQNGGQVEVGGEAVFEVLAKNSGNQTINDVKVSLQSDSGLQHARDNLNTLEREIGFLNPGQTIKLDGVFRIEREGDLSVKATVTSNRQVLATQTAIVRGLPATPKRPSVSLEINSELRQSAVPVGSKFKLNWIVTNTGPVPLRSPVVMLQHSTNIEPTDLTPGEPYERERQFQRWRLQDLPVGGRVVLEGNFVARSAGQQANVIIAVETADGVGDKKTFAIDVGNASPGGDVLPGNSAQPGVFPPGASGQRNKPATNLNDQAENRLSLTIQPVSNSIRKGDLGTYEIRIENLINKPDQRVALSLLTPQGTVLNSIRAKDLQYKVVNNDRQIDLEPIKYFRPNDTFSCVIQLRHNEVSSGELIASVTSMGQTTPVTKSHRIQVLDR